MRRPIAPSLSPNTEKDDVLLALKTLFSPWVWFDEKQVENFEKDFAEMFGKNYKALAVNSGRSAQFLILKALGIGKGDKVAIQAFTCVVVPNSILWTKASPLYIDIDESYNMDPEDLKRKIDEKTRAIIVQHTFGIPARLSSIIQIASKKNIPIIEDCAHSLGAKYQGRLVGTFGKASFFSFGRDKVLSSVFGGVIICSDKIFYKKIKKLRDKLDRPPTTWVIQQLLHPLALGVILPSYNFYLGKAMLFLLQKTKLLSKAVYEEEKKGIRPRFFPAKMAGAFAILARNQLKKLGRFNKLRQRISRYYQEELKDTVDILPPQKPGSIWLRFPLKIKDSRRLLKFAKTKKILFGDWYKQVVMPSKNLANSGYIRGSCPNAERLAECVVNLPTYPTLESQEVKKVVYILKQWLNTK